MLLFLYYTFFLSIVTVELPLSAGKNKILSSLLRSLMAFCCCLVMFGLYLRNFWCLTVDLTPFLRVCAASLSSAFHWLVSVLFKSKVEASDNTSVSDAVSILLLLLTTVCFMLLPLFLCFSFNCCFSVISSCSYLICLPFTSLNVFPLASSAQLITCSSFPGVIIIDSSFLTSPINLLRWQLCLRACCIHSLKMAVFAHCAIRLLLAELVVSILRCSPFGITLLLLHIIKKFRLFLNFASFTRRFFNLFATQFAKRILWHILKISDCYANR